MSRNPCRTCEKSFVYKNRHMPGWKCKHGCERYGEHQKYLETKRKFRKGERITSLEELLSKRWVMWGHTPRHIEVIKCMQLRSVIKFIEAGYFYDAIRKEVI